MKSYIKSSFLMVLLSAIFTVGFSSATAKTVKKDKKATKTTNVKPLPLRCQMQISKAKIISDYSQKGVVNFLLALQDPTCEPGTFRQGNYVLVVQSDCKVHRYSISNKKFHQLTKT